MIQRSGSRSPRRDRPRSRSPIRNRSRSPRRDYPSRGHGHGHGRDSYNSYHSRREGGGSFRTFPRRMGDFGGHSNGGGNGGGGRFGGSALGPQDRRVYVGNLAYDVRWQQLKDFMKQAGDVVRADVLIGPNGRSKGCGIVEYATADEAQRAVETLNNQSLNNRLVFIREDRESGSRSSHNGPPPSSGAGPGSFSRDRVGGGGGASSGPPPVPGTQLFVNNLPYSTGWQELKDLFRSSGNVLRVDLKLNFNGKSRGAATVLFETPEEAQAAIQQYNGYDFQGRPLEVRQDRYVGGSAPASFSSAPPNPFTDGAKGSGEPSNIIYASNLPWSTTNQDLEELFGTIGPVEKAEIQLLPNGRSAGAGVIQLDSIESAQNAILKLSGYNYGNRDLIISFVNYNR
ncbi:Hrb1p [Sugiyamaella lignohabitans]|uniref:Hrb1p n=1 Tax=Sugiyamaella lignohabitans TaxID=796027 RepID=A0A167FLU2_9ASCO|nr:Hrb1p [Sugiyamaella lignohabitans]ANB15462.1 Hrb1p [Sugiyamaella lignohabitans]